MDISTLFDVKGKVVLVTGGAKGIGRMISEGFVTNGAKVYMSGRSMTDGEETATQLNALGKGQAIFITSDLYKEDDMKRLAGEIARREPLNNAGSAWAAPYAEFPESAWTRVLTLNLQRVFSLTQLLTPLLEKAGTQNDPARIIHIGSVDAIKVPSVENFSYSAAKAGLHQLSRVLANHLGRRNITSNTLACGPFSTKMTASMFQAGSAEIVNAVPLRRTGLPEDAAGSCLFLSSKAGAFVNGATIELDGGYVVNSRL